MNTRRNFVRGLSGLGAIVATGHAPAIVKSMIAARGTMLGGAHAWTNPYITDCLVAMFDGEWNAGGGVHDAAANTWKNLTGNGELVYSNGITINDDSVGFAFGASVYSNNNMGLTTSNVLHGELCIEMASPPLNEQYAQFASSPSRIFANAYSSRGGISLLSGQLGHGNWPTGKHTMSVNWPSNELHIDSVLRDTVTTKDSWSLRTKSTVIGNVFADSSNRGFNGKVYCIRLYSRALTDDEIAANDEVDKKRFNLAS